MTAVQQGTNIGNKYLVGTSANVDVDPSFVTSKISTNLVGSTYHIYDGGVKYSKGVKEDSIRKELATVTYVKKNLFF